MKVRIKFSKLGPVKFVGHLDTMRYFQKAVRRSGLPAAFSPAVGTLAHRLRVPVLVAAGVRDWESDRVVLRSFREFTAEETAAMAPDELTRAIADAIGGMILRWPEQWLWTYRRWKRWQPGDDPKRFPWYAKLDPLAPPFVPPAAPAP